MKHFIEQYRNLLLLPPSLTSLEEAVQLTTQVYTSLFNSEPECFSQAPFQEYDGRINKKLFEVLLRAASILKSFPVEIDKQKISNTQHSFIIDCCVLVSHQAYFTFIEQVPSRNKYPRSVFLESFHFFASSLPDLIEQNRLLALYYEAIGDRKKTIVCFRKTLLAIAADAHEFMSLLQSYWTYLIGEELYHDAFRLLLENYPRVPRRDIEEISELLMLTFQIVEKKQKRLKAA